MAARILVADDSVTIQKVVELTFSKEDFVLVQARSGEEAIRKAKEERPDLVLLDLVMPDKSGYEVCAALRAEPVLRAVPIILLTGTFEAFDKDKGMQAGANDFVTKPFESQVLISKVKQLLFAKMVDVAPSAPASEQAKTVPLKGGPRPVPATAAPAPAGISPRPGAASGLSRGAPPGVMRGPVPPSPAPTPTSRGVVLPAGSPAMPTPPPVSPAAAPVGQVRPRPASSKTGPPTPTPMATAVAPERPVPTELATPPRVGRTLDLSPPSEEISQDRVRSVVEPPSTVPPSPATGGLGELSLEDLASLPLPEKPAGGRDLHLALESAASGPPTVPEELSLEMPSLAPQPDQSEQAPPNPDAGMGTLPESLSLEDLLSADVTGGPLATEPALAPLEDLPGGPVFDLTSEMGGPSLPLVEVGSGEPPSLSIEDLLTSAGADEVVAPEMSAPGPQMIPEQLPGGPVFDLTSAQELTPPAPPEVKAEERSALSIEDLLPPRQGASVEAAGMGLHEIELELISGPPTAEGPATELAPAAPPLELGSLVEEPVAPVQRVDLEAAMTAGQEPVAPASPPEVQPTLPAMEAGTVLTDIPAAEGTLRETAVAPPIGSRMSGMETVPPATAVMPSPGVAEALVPEMAAMRQEVTERVAHELARDLSDKLLERIERIVWEVVPDLAEILITKEIERIRSQAEGKQSS